MGRAVFLPCYLTRNQTMEEVMKIMGTSFKRSHAFTSTISAPDPAAGHHQPMPLLETLRNSQASLGQSFLGSLLLSHGSWYAQSSVCALQESISQSFVSSGSSMVGLMVTSSKRAYAIPRSAATRAPAPATVHCWSIHPQETLKRSSVSVSVRSLGPGVHRFVWALWEFPTGMGFGFKHDFALPTILLTFISYIYYS